MRFVLLAALLLISSPAFAAKLISTNEPAYLPVFGIGSTTSVLFTTAAQGSVSPMVPAGGSATELVRVFTTQNAYVAIGTDPNPTSADMVVVANTEMILEVLSGHRIGAKSQSVNGALYVTHLVTFPNSN